MNEQTAGPGATTDELTQRVAHVHERIARALEAAGREPASLRLLLATKTRDAHEIRAAIEAFAALGMPVVVGENRAQEMAKHAELDDLAAAGLERHFIGRIQTNKARDIVRFSNLIHSVDRPDLIDALERRADADGITQRILLQVNTSGEDSKGGFAPDPGLIAEQVARCRATGVLVPEGLMTIGAHSTDAARVRSSLALLASLREQVGDPALTELSMGMSGDLEVAIAEGATIVRLGSAVFGPRPQ